MSSDKSKLDEVFTQEGQVKKGGRNPAPSTPKPATPATGQGPRNTGKKPSKRR